MRAVVQRVSSAKVDIEGVSISEIGRGLLVLLGIKPDDTEEDIRLLAHKTLNLRIFPSQENGLEFHTSVMEIGAELLLVSQFTLYAGIRKGRRPSFSSAAPSDFASKVFDRAVEVFRESGLRVMAGGFGAKMEVGLTNTGPATFIVDTDDLRAPRRS